MSACFVFFWLFFSQSLRPARSFVCRSVGRLLFYLCSLSVASFQLWLFSARFFSDLVFSRPVFFGGFLFCFRFCGFFLLLPGFRFDRRQFICLSLNSFSFVGGAFSIFFSFFSVGFFCLALSAFFFGFVLLVPAFS